MNRIYSLVWNRSLGVLQAASESIRAKQGGTTAAAARTSSHRRSIVLACAAAVALGGFTLPAWSATCPSGSTQWSGGTGTAGADGAQGFYNTGSGGFGGPGGDGGNGSDAKGSVAAGTYCLLTSLVGGKGGKGGEGGGGGGRVTGGQGGDGGDGGNGVSGNGFVLTSYGSIQGGDGGSGGAGGYAGWMGAAGGSGVGGVGVVATGGATVTNAGNISGGRANDGTGAKAAAVEFSGGGNTLTLEVGSTVSGDIVSAGGDTFVLGDNSSGGGSDTLNIGTVSGFTTYKKTGTSTWTLTGSGSTSQQWTIVAGTLIGDSQSLTGNIDDNAALTFDQATGGTYAGVVSGAGMLAKTGAGTLKLTRANTYAGGTTVDGGTLEVATGGALGTGTATVDNSGNKDATLKIDLGVSLSNKIVLNNGATLDNAGGTINVTSASQAVESDSGTATVSNHGGGVISGGTEDAVLFMHGGSVVNSGSGTKITSNVPGHSAVAVGGGTGSITNTDGAVIHALYTGVNLSLGSVTNSGVGSRIVSDTDNAVFIGGGAGDVVNSDGGKISGAKAGANLRKGGSVTNDVGSTIHGSNASVVIVGGAATLNNAGTLDGTVALGGDANTVTLTAGGSIAGDLDIGANVSSTLTLDGGTGTSQAYSAAVTGSTTFDGVLNKAGDGKWTIDSDDLASVSGTTISAGTLQVGDGDATGSIGNGDIVDDGSLVFDRSDDVSYTGVISGGGTLEQSGGGTLKLTRANTYTGGTVVDAGTLEIAVGGTLGTGVATIDNSADHDAMLKVDSGVSLSNDIVLNNGSKLDNAGALGTASSTHNGVTSNAGTAAVTNHDGGTIIGHQTGVALNHGGVVINDGAGSKIVADGPLSGSSDGIFIQHGSGTVTNTHGANISGQGTGVALMQGGVVTNGAGSSMAGRGYSVFVSGAAATLGNAGTLTGDILLADYANTVTLTAGGSIAGDLDIGTNASSTLTLDGGAGTSQVYSTAVTGSTTLDGALIKTGEGEWTIDGDDLASISGTTISAGTLQVGNGGTTGTIGTGDVADAGSLVFNRSDDVTYSGVISGNGTLAQTGSGSLILNAASPLTGITSVKSGTLIVGDDGHAGASLGGMVVVAKGATLGGFGTVEGLDLSGTLSPGHSIGTLHVQGDATFEKSSTFNVEADADGNADRLAANGKVTIKGGSVVVIAKTGNWAPRTTYTIITADKGVSGAFGGVSDNLTFLTPVLSYKANAVQLALQRNDINLASVASTPNGKGVAGAENGLGWSSPLYAALVLLDPATARVAFGQTSAEFHASQQSARVDDSRFVREAMDQRLREGDADSEATHGQHVTAWVHGWGHWSSFKGDDGAAKLSDNGSGVLVGADLSIGKAGRVGVTGGVSRDTMNVRYGSSGAKLTAQWLGVYAGFERGAFAFRAGAAYAWENIPGHRQVHFPGFKESLSSRATGQTGTAYVEGAWTFRVANGNIAPYLNLATVNVHSDALAETGGAAALRATSQNMDTIVGTLGARGAWQLAGKVSLHANLGWQHASGDITPERSQRFVAGGAAFVVYGAPVARNAGVVKLGVNWQVAKNVQFTAGYEGQRGSGAKDNAAKLGLNVMF